MLHCVHPLVANFVNVLFGAGMVVIGFVWAFFCIRQPPAVGRNEATRELMKAMIVNKNSKVADYVIKTMSLKDTEKAL